MAKASRPVARTPAPVGLAARLRDGELERITLLSDGVFAISATLAAVELGREGVPALRELLGYAVSYYVIAVFWWANRDLFNRLRAIDAPLTILVLTLLCVVAVIPAATRNMYLAPGGGISGFYTLTMTVAGLLNCGQWLYVALRTHLPHDDLPRRYLWTRVGTTATVPVVFGAMALLPVHAWPIAAPVAILLVLAVRRIVPRLIGGQG